MSKNRVDTWVGSPLPGWEPMGIAEPLPYRIARCCWGRGTMPAHPSGPRLRGLLIPVLLLLGLSLRSYHYLRDRAVWQDEAGLLLTVTARGYHDLFLGQLDYH